MSEKLPTTLLKCIGVRNWGEYPKKQICPFRFHVHTMEELQEHKLPLPSNSMCREQSRYAF